MGPYATSYGVVTLSRLPMVDLSMWKLPTKMGRSVLVASYLINGKPVRSLLPRLRVTT